MLNWEYYWSPFLQQHFSRGIDWREKLAVKLVIVLILPSLKNISFVAIISLSWILVVILSISQHVASNLWLAWPRYWLSQGAGVRLTANATTAKPKLNNHDVKIQFWSPGDYKCWVLVPCKLLLRLPLQFQPLHLMIAAMRHWWMSLITAGCKQQLKYYECSEIHLWSHLFYIGW